MLNAILKNIKNIFSKPVTCNYPFEKAKTKAKYRGLIKYNEEECIFCDKCENVCPPNAIIFTQALDGAKEYNYNPYLCIYCSECVRECPKTQKALWQDESFSTPATKEDLVNENWFKLQKEAKESRIAYKELKKSQKAKKSL